MFLAVALMAGVTLLASGCASGPPHKGAQHHAAASASTRRPVTKPEVLDTTSSTSTTTTTPPTTTTVPKSAHAAPAPPPTTTTAPPLPQCNWADFSALVATDQGAYPQGQTVHITLTYRNNGPSCGAYATGYACPRIDVDNAAGQTTWTSVPQPTTGCPSVYSPTSPAVLANAWSQSFAFDWTQADCSTRTGGEAGSCSGPQVDPGQYQVIGLDSGGASTIAPSAPTSVTIT